jgi:hypothetical protein
MPIRIRIGFQILWMHSLGVYRSSAQKVRYMGYNEAVALTC